MMTDFVNVPNTRAQRAVSVSHYETVERDKTAYNTISRSIRECQPRRVRDKSYACFYAVAAAYIYVLLDR